MYFVYIQYYIFKRDLSLQFYFNLISVFKIPFFRKINYLECIFVQIIFCFRILNLKSMRLIKSLSLLFVLQTNMLSVRSQNITQTGTYDGTIGTDRIILIADQSDAAVLKGFFVMNRGVAVEETHSFNINFDGRRIFFQSDLYPGKMKTSTFTATGFQGRMVLLNGKRRFLFFRPKIDISFIRRAEPQSVEPTQRYQEEIFPRIDVKSDLVYGKARGYWTNQPYSDEPYITTLRKGLIKSFSDGKLLDLKLDVYYPKTDLFKNRPCVMLIHGGAFYIGSKESACERTLATTLAKRGYLVASIDYRLGFKPTPGEIEMSAYRAIQDANAALRFLAHNAKGLGIDPNQIYIGGTSAGGVASLNTAFMTNDERPQRILEASRKGLIGKIEESGNKYTETFKIKAVINMWGAVSDLSIIGKDEQIPVLSIHGTADDIVPYENDYPFKNALMINRLVMDKMYGSKLIHDRLQSFGIRNKLVSLPGLGHEPELATYNTLNFWMDTITANVTRFLYEETAPNVVLPPAQLKIRETDRVRPFTFDVDNGSLAGFSVNGGVKTTVDPFDTSVIWFKNADRKTLVFLSRNKFEAWRRQEFPVTIVK
jgi:alpha/beta superfamily hydrolase